MNKIFVSGNYIIVSTATILAEFLMSKSMYTQEGAVLKLTEERGGSLAIALADAATWFDEAGLIAFDAATLTQFMRDNTGVDTASVKRQTVVIDIATAPASIVINADPNNGDKVIIAAETSGLNGDFDIDFRTASTVDSPAPESVDVIAAVSLSDPTILRTAGVKSDMNGDFLIAGFSGDATAGTVTLHITFK